MIYKIANKDYNIIVERKRNKNTYISFDQELNIIVRTNYLTSDKKIIKILDDNYDYLLKMLSKRVKQKEKEGYFYYLGNRYDIILLSSIKKVEISNDKIYTKDDKSLLKWYKEEMKRVFLERLEYNYSRFTEDIPYPNLRIRTMKTRWGVCNRKTNTITLNSLLIKESMDKIDYVIVHELSHFVHFDHSKEFWAVVCKYCPEYKKIRKDMKE